MSGYLWLLGVFVAALVGGFLAGVPIAALALTFSAINVVHVAIFVTAMFAGLGATWMGNWLVPDAKSRHLLRIVGTAEATGLVLAIVLAWVVSLGTVTLNSLIILLGVAVVVIAVAATVATWRFPARVARQSQDAMVSLGLLGVTSFFVMWAVALVLMLGQFGI